MERLLPLTTIGFTVLSALLCLAPAPATGPGTERYAAPPAAGVTFSAKVVGEKLESVVTPEDRAHPVDVVMTYRFLPGPSGETSWEARHLPGPFTETGPLDNLAFTTKLERATWRRQRWIVVTGYARPSGTDQPYRPFDSQLVDLAKVANSTTAPAHE
jgi:hypothetical protein